MTSFAGENKYAHYGIFNVGNRTGSDFGEGPFQLTSLHYSGDAGDSLAYNNGEAFSTSDADNDEWSGNCADYYKSGWWHKYNAQTNLNGVYFDDSQVGDTTAHWISFSDSQEALKTIVMMTRPLQQQ
ncbi:unnamed protein product [Meganyctiphanes norvegica]|uniref:Fibrinogen C-terminal domain-containing protein n=1 Tax=Meganyctiphanes norvegica TaxID=48144 RepID=A0AAV2SL90_MEGNR